MASLALGIAGLCTFGLSAIAGLILGIVAIHKIANSQGRIKGRALAIAGIIVSAVMIILGPAISLPLLGLLIIFRNESSQSVIDTWDEARQPQPPTGGWHAHEALCVGMSCARQIACRANSVLGMPPHRPPHLTEPLPPQVRAQLRAPSRRDQPPA